MGRIVGGLGGLIGEAMGINEFLMSLELYGFEKYLGRGADSIGNWLNGDRWMVRKRDKLWKVSRCGESSGELPIHGSGDQRARAIDRKAGGPLKALISTRILEEKSLPFLPSGATESHVYPDHHFQALN